MLRRAGGGGIPNGGGGIFLGGGGTLPFYPRGIGFYYKFTEVGLSLLNVLLSLNLVVRNVDRVFIICWFLGGDYLASS